MDATILHDPVTASLAARCELEETAVRFPPHLRLLMQQPMVADPLALPRSVLGVLLEFADHHSLHQLEAVCRTASTLVDAAGTFPRSTPLCDDIDSRWKRMACLTTIPCQRERNLLLDVHACSSIDRACESPSNTLILSRCWLSMQSLSDRTMSLRSLRDANNPHTALQNLAEVAQIECGCETLACYWSSSPSPSQHAQDFIEYTTRANCLVSKIQVLPYRAFWHPDSPTFAPRCVSFVFYAPATAATAHEDFPVGNNENENSSNNGVALFSSDVKMLSDEDDAAASEYKTRVKVYESPVYTMLNDMQLHEFELPRKVWLAHGATFRLNLIGRYQQETFEMPPWIPADEQEPAEPPYYCCLSYVNAIGVSYDYR